MKIRLALIDSDEDYRKRLSDFYIKNYHDRIEILTFSSLDSFENNRGNKTIDVMLVAEDIEEDLSLYNGKISIAYLSDRDLIERKNNIKTINKFKKPDKIYKEILNILADGANGDIAYIISSNPTLLSPSKNIPDEFNVSKFKYKVGIPFIASFFPYAIAKEVAPAPPFTDINTSTVV